MLLLSIVENHLFYRSREIHLHTREMQASKLSLPN